MWVSISGQGKENLSGNMIYSVDVVVPLEDAQEAIDKIDALWDDHKPKGAKEPKSTGYKLSEDETEVTFTFKTNTVFPSGDKKVIDIFDRKVSKIKLDDNVKIGNGSTGKASGIVSIYKAGKNMGTTIYLDAIQLLKLVEYQAAGDGFDEVEDDGEMFETAFELEEA